VAKAGKKKVKKSVQSGVVHVQSTFNNTIISITDPSGGVAAWASAGGAGFKGSRKSTPFAAQVAAEECAKKAMEHGVRQASVYVKGPGSGRESAVARDPGGGHQGDADQGRHADPPQRLSAQEAPARLEDIEWLATTMQCVGSAVGKAPSSS
jgi:small subunit ribosomal protein S11